MGIVDSDRDIAIERILESASRWVDRVLGRRFYTTDAPETRIYTASECYWELAVDDLLSVTSLATDNDNNGTFETIWSVGTDYWLGPKNAALDGEPYRTIHRVWYTGRYSFPSYENGVSVTGQFGYCTLANCPSNIRELTMMVAESDALPILDLTMPGVQNYKLGTELTITMGSRRLPSRAAEIMDLYKTARGWMA